MAEKGRMTVREAGQKGGRTTFKKHGPEFYESIGKKGGQATSKKYGHGFYEEIGHKGGQKVRNLIKRGKEAK